MSRRQYIAAILLEISKEATLNYLTDKYESNWHSRDKQNILKSKDNCPLAICNSNKYISLTSCIEKLSISWIDRLKSNKGEGNKFFKFWLKMIGCIWIKELSMRRKRCRGHLTEISCNNKGIAFICCSSWWGLCFIHILSPLTLLLSFFSLSIMLFVLFASSFALAVLLSMILLLTIHTSLLVDNLWFWQECKSSIIWASWTVECRIILDNIIDSVNEFGRSYIRKSTLYLKYTGMV